MSISDAVLDSGVDGVIVRQVFFCGFQGKYGSNYVSATLREEDQTQPPRDSTFHAEKLL